MPSASSTTKTYIYLQNGLHEEIQATLSIPAYYPPSPIYPEGSSETWVDITASIPFAITHDLYVDVKTKTDYYSYGSSGTSYHDWQVRIPAGQTSATRNVLGGVVSTKDNLVTSQYDYTFTMLEQKEAPQELPPLVLSHTKSDVTCWDGENGVISVSVSGGKSPFTFFWDGVNSGGLASRIDLKAGTYSVMVQDADGVQATISDIIISQPTQIDATFQIVNASCFDSKNGIINVSASGGAGGYTYKWSDGSTLQNRTGLAAGSYTLTIKDQDGCSRSFNLTITQPSQIKVTTNIEGRSASVDATGGTPPYTYLWSDNVMVKDRTNMENGTYIVTVIDSKKCQVSVTVVISDFKFYFSKNPVWLLLKAIDPETKPNLSFKLDAFLEDEYLSNTFSLKYSTEHPARVDGSTDFDMQEVLNAFLSASVPGFAEAQPLQVRESFKRFYLQHSEVYGNPPVPAPFTQVDTFYVLYGGLSDQEFAKKTFFKSYLDTQKPFLSWQPRTKEVVQRQHEYLHYVVVNPLLTELNLFARIKYASGTELSVQLRNVTNVQPYEVYRFPAGYQQLGLQNFNPGQTVTSYTLYLKFGEEVVSEERTYKVIEEQGHYKIFLYLNSLGGWDTLLAKGRGKSKIRTREEAIDRELPTEFTYSTRAKEVTSKTGERTADVVIGNLISGEKKHLVDLSISEKVYEQTKSGYLPVDVKFDFDLTDDMEQLDEEVSFDVTYPTIKRHTPEL